MVKNVLERYVIKDWKLKLLSLVLAIMLWYTVFQIGEPKKDLTIPVSIAHLPKNMMVTKMDPERVFVTVSGRVSLLKDLKDRDVSVVINLNGIKEGEAVFNFSKANVNVPRGIEVVDIRPGTLRLTADRILEKSLKVLPKLDKKWKGRYDISSVSPQYVTAEGPRRLLEKLATIHTMPINGDLHHNEETVTVGLDLEDVHQTNVRPDNIRITLKKHSGRDNPE
ncbi:MAG: CdaR family protein [Syntrophorhabdaceae bacterium]|nr:CdaR family protein [Syntrophorhabdaceae bacterium]MDD4196498.1 CdaR family protein [Syntrophorhabdaceae bacterium]